MAAIDHVDEDLKLEPPSLRLGEAFTAGKNNTLIIFGRDRPTTVESGYGTGPGAGTIHIIAGRKQRDPSFSDDSAFIYATMKTDVDKNLGIDSMTGGDGSGIPAKVGPAIITKSDNVRLVYRGTGDIRIVSETGDNFIRISDESCEIKIGASWLKVKDGTITVEAGTIQLGSGATKERIVLGDTFMNQVFNLHTHQSPVGPTSKPLLQMMDVHLSKKSKVE